MTGLLKRKTGGMPGWLSQLPPGHWMPGATRNWKGQGKTLFQMLQWEHRLATAWFYIFSLQNCGRINSSCLKPPRLWYFVITTLGNFLNPAVPDPPTSTSEHFWITEMGENSTKLLTLVLHLSLGIKTTFIHHIFNDETADCRNHSDSISHQNGSWPVSSGGHQTAGFLDCQVLCKPWSYQKAGFSEEGI